MSYVSPKVQPYFDNLSSELKNEILSRNIRLESLTDLIHCLEAIVNEE